MADERQDQPTQQTPKGLEIPVPEREDVMRDFRRAFKPDEPDKDDRSSRHPYGPGTMRPDPEPEDPSIVERDSG